MAARGNSSDGTAGVKVRFLEPSPSFSDLEFVADPSETAASIHEESPQL